MHERRKFERIKAEMLVSYTRAEGIAVGGLCKSVDISLGGIGLLMPCKVEGGELFNLVIKIPGLVKKFYVTARIINIVHIPAEEEKEYLCRVGLVFVNITDEQRKILQGVIKHLAEEEKT